VKRLVVGRSKNARLLESAYGRKVLLEKTLSSFGINKTAKVENQTKQKALYHNP
jgi:hypothetical protein